MSVLRRVTMPAKGAVIFGSSAGFAGLQVGPAASTAACAASNDVRA
jgi:hypothetical protein